MKDPYSGHKLVVCKILMDAFHLFYQCNFTICICYYQPLFTHNELKSVAESLRETVVEAKSDLLSLPFLIKRKIQLKIKSSPMIMR